MQRRDFLRGGAIGVLALGMGRVSAASHLHDLPAAVPTPPLADLTTLPSGEPLRSLPTLTNRSAVDRLFIGDLVAGSAQRQWAQGHPTTVWAYNGQMPGPLIELWEGDTAEIHFQNHLASPTTVHWHGLSVPVSADGGPHHPVAPGKQQVYRLPIGKDAAGSYWYHPHPHGHTAEQVFHGLAGPLIVRSKQDPLSHLAERHLFITDLRVAADGQLPADDANDWMNGREGQVVMINGQYQPVIEVRESQRWRIWNACSARYLRLSLGGMPFTQVGTDGGLTQAPRAGLTEIVLAPAERVEIVVDPAAAASSCELTALIYPRGKMGGDVQPDTAIKLAQVHVGQGMAAPLPSTLRDIAALGPEKRRHVIRIQEDMSMAGGHHS
ncbi:MAG: multicopper oxidase domain-containing protein, partial [Burkholderiales bacterium]|nr:multicopper oxidase domain-containing protein [Burkholderiales bacterium]